MANISMANIRTLSPLPSPVPSAAASASPDAAQVRKVTKAAKQFEALLLESLLGPLEKTFSSLTGKQDQPGAGEYEQLGTQALASGLAASGGLGIAAMIVRNLLKSSSGHGSGGSSKSKVSWPAADKS